MSILEKEHGRIEQRICKKIGDISWLGEEWSGIKYIFSIRRIAEENHRKSDETRYYITSVDAQPQRLMEIARTWKIESMHCMLDVVFSEDKCLLRDEEAQLTMNSFRKLALALHKNYVKQKWKKALSQAVCYDACSIILSFVTSSQIYEAAVGSCYTHIVFV